MRWDKKYAGTILLQGVSKPAMCPQTTLFDHTHSGIGLLKRRILSVKGLAQIQGKALVWSLCEQRRDEVPSVALCARQPRGVDAAGVNGDAVQSR
jgi:hypothetical protein